MGLLGSGKTYFARALAEYLGALHLNSDRVRKELLDQPAYSLADKSRVYVRIFKPCTETLVMRWLDATFSKSAYRESYLSSTDAHEYPYSSFS